MKETVVWRAVNHGTTEKQIMDGDLRPDAVRLVLQPKLLLVERPTLGGQRIQAISSHFPPPLGLRPEPEDPTEKRARGCWHVTDPQTYQWNAGHSQTAVSGTAKPNRVVCVYGGPVRDLVLLVCRVSASSFSLSELRITKSSNFALQVRHFAPLHRSVVASCHIITDMRY